MTRQLALIPEPDPSAEVLGLDLTALAMTPAEVAALTREQREARLDALIAEAEAIFAGSIRTQVTDEGKAVAGVVLLFSGGNDSTVLSHLMRRHATHVAHANTGVGIEATRQYVRDTTAAWGLPLLERRAPQARDSYRAHVIRYGFPGRGMHPRMYQRLKERALELVRNELVGAAGGPRRARVVFVAGRRRTESEKRATVPAVERKGSTVWSSPLVNWTKMDMNTYRLRCAREGDPVPVNETADLIHMSGECLCGCYAQEGERAMLVAFAPDDMAVILALEAEIADRVDIPEYARTWGWSWDRALNDASRVRSARPRPGYLCGACAPDAGTVTTPLW